MPKVLTAARVRVPAQNEAEYVNTLRELSQFAEARGQRIWLFRNAKDPRLFIEFSESPTEMSHRAQASRGDPHVVHALDVLGVEDAVGVLEQLPGAHRHGRSSSLGVGHVVGAEVVHRPPEDPGRARRGAGAVLVDEAVAVVVSGIAGGVVVSDRRGAGAAAA